MAGWNPGACRWAGFRYGVAANVVEVAWSGYSSGNEQSARGASIRSAHAQPGYFPAPQGKVAPPRLFPTSVASA